ncbi:hypothetical protein [Streptomyces sp. MUM 178J]|uniref:hypothetical protein n=1 Tax=Streptomyces sp. MUM 178J TaxID=2791991 RepID=UPI001F04D129|nr:hypothetical protein [Streptomyces sp. MUM 178J]WRQ80312.1 hypothetical protein I3F59_013655 [Streptomyces sp. MUM 178J]
MRRPPRRSAALLLGALLAALPAATSFADGDGPVHRGGPSRQQGVVTSADAAVPFAWVTLYQAGDRRGGEARQLGRARADGEGRFTVEYERPKKPGTVLYLIADAGRQDGGKQSEGKQARGHGPVRLAAVLLPEAQPTPVTVNERTTVAAAYAMARFTHGPHIAGGHPGLQNAAGTSHNLADVKTGKVSAVLDAPPNGAETSTLRAFNSLANILAGCVAGETCEELFQLATPAGGDAPRDTFQAAVDIAHAPGRNAAALYGLSELAGSSYEPHLTSPPDAWTLALRYVGNGHELDGPGNVAFDADGNAWIINNYHYNRDPLITVCGGEQLTKLTPTGGDAPGAPFRGGGLYGAGYGVTLDPKGHVWVGNFGFQGRGCTYDQDFLSRSVSQFREDGTALSPTVGWRQGDISRPMGTVSDRKGNIWVANCGNDTVTRIPDGRPKRARNIAPPEGTLVKPFSIAIDTRGRAWVSSNRTDSVLMLSPDGQPRRSVSGGGISAPMGLASDSLGNVWVANSALADPPCSGTPSPLPPTDGVDPVEGAADASVTLIRPDGSTSRPFEDGGLFLPWGIAVDGNDTVWVANFGGQRVAQLCGARPEGCPPGHRTGQPISPADTGYTSDGLSRNTGLQIDPSGNVWVANNWETVPLQTNPGGHEMVVFVGIAEPVRTPLIGTPRSVS